MTSDKDNILELPETIRCPKCGYFVSTDATECRFCQAALSETIHSLKRTIKENLRKLDEAKAEDARRVQAEIDAKQQRRKAFLSNKTNWAIALGATTAVVAGTIVLTPPPLTDAEVAFQSGCVSIQANLDDFLSTQIMMSDLRPDWWFWPEGYAVTNAGINTRTMARNLIDTSYPWIESATNENLASISRSKFLQHSGGHFVDGNFSNDFVAWLLAGSSIQVVETAEAGYRDPVQVLQNSIRAVTPVGRFDDCESALGLKGGTIMASAITEGEAEFTGLRAILATRVDIWGCDRFGMGYADWKWNGRGTKCARSDFSG